jgi:hypothetical protein
MAFCCNPRRHTPHSVGQMPWRRGCRVVTHISCPLVPGRGQPTPARRLKPGVLVRGVVDDQVDDDPDAVCAGALGKLHEVIQRSALRVDSVVVLNIVPWPRVGDGWNGVSQRAVTPKPARYSMRRISPSKSPTPPPVGFDGSTECAA